MSLNQNIRYKDVDLNDVNNPNGLYDYLILGQTLSGVGAPSNSIGTLNSTYIDTSTGYEYIKSSGVWTPFVNFSSFTVIPDPLHLGTLDVNTVKGNSGENVQVDLGIAGNLQVGPTAHLNRVSILSDGTVQTVGSTSNFLVADGLGNQTDIQPQAITGSNALTITGNTGLALGSISNDIQFDSANNVILNPSNIILAQQGVYMASGQKYTSQDDGTSGVLVGSDSVILQCSNNNVVSASTASCDFLVGGNASLSVQGAAIAVSTSILPTSSFSYNLGAPSNIFSETHTNTVFLQNGTAAQPTLCFENDLSTGIHGSPGNVMVSVSGIDRSTITSANITNTVPILQPDGTAGVPSYSFSSSTNDGIMWAAPHTVSFTSNGVSTLAITPGTIFTAATIQPNANNTYDLGTNSMAWRNIYSNNLLNVISDMRAKKDVKELNEGLDLIKALRPVSYKLLADSDDSKPNMGFIAQEVDLLCGDYNIVNKSDTSMMSLKYDMLIAPLIKAVQQLSERLEKLESKL